MADIATPPAPAAAPSAAPTPAAGKPTSPITSPNFKPSFDRLVDIAKSNDETGGPPKNPSKPNPKPADKPRQEAPKPPVEPAKETPKVAPTKPEPLVKSEPVAEPAAKYDRFEDLPTDEQAAKMPAGKVSKALKAARAMIETYKKQAESVGDPTKAPEFSKVAEENKALKTKYEAAQNALRLKDYEATEDFQNNFYKPYESAVNSGRSKVASMKVIQRLNPDTGEVTQQAREATAQDFDRILYAGDEEAAEMAEQLFGPTKAGMVWALRDKVHDRLAAKNEATERMRKEGAEQMKTLQEANTRTMQEAQNAFKQEAENGLKQSWLKPIDGDEAGNAKLNESSEFVRALFGGVFKDDNGNVVARPTQKQLAQRQAQIMNLAIAAPRAIAQNKAYKAQIAEMQKELDQYKASGPGEGDGNGKTQAANGSTIDSAFDRLRRKAS